MGTLRGWKEEIARGKRKEREEGRWCNSILGILSAKWLNKAVEPAGTYILSHFTKILISIWWLMVQYEGIMEFKQPGNLSLLIRDQNCKICNYLHTCPRILAVSSQQHKISFPVLQDWASEERDQSPETLTQSLELWHVSPCRTSRGPLTNRCQAD